MEEDEERGWSSGGDKYVCAEHVEDDVLITLIAENTSSTPCSHCGREGGAPVDVLIERIGSSLPYEWGNADDEGVGWEGATSARPTTPTSCSRKPATRRSTTGS